MREAEKQISLLNNQIQKKKESLENEKKINSQLRQENAEMKARFEDISRKWKVLKEQLEKVKSV